MSHVQVRSDPGATALHDPDWWEWNERVWGVRTHQFNFSVDGNSATHLTAAFFTGPSGKVKTPPLVCCVPVARVDNTTSHRRVESRAREWIALADQLSDELTSTGIVGGTVLPTGLFDGRPFRMAWASDQGLVHLSCLAPTQAVNGYSSDRRRVRKATARGYLVDRSGIRACLKSTEQAKGFRHRLREQDLDLGERLPGEESFRIRRARSERSAGFRRRQNSRSGSSGSGFGCRVRPALPDGVQ